MKKKEVEEFTDLVYELIDQMGHTDVLQDVRRWEQTKRPLLKIQDHPLYVDAKKRKWERFWKHCEKAAKEVEKWPAWKKGERVNSR